MTNPLPAAIGQFGGEPVTWEYFLYKAGRGSSHVAEVISCAEEYLLSLNVLGSMEEQWDVIRNGDPSKLLVDICPWSSQADFVRDLTDVAGINNGERLGSNMTYEEEYYSELWDKQIQVDALQMIEDSWEAIIRSWTADGYEDLEPHSNALHAVAAMVRLAVSIKSLEERAAGR